jgi:ferredoxin-nitrite reductase
MVEHATSGDFTPEQKRYLEGFVTGIQAAARKPQAAAATIEPAAGPDAAHRAAQGRVMAAGGKLVDQEKWKRDQHPFDAYTKLKGQAAAGAYPKPDDNFRWRFYGLFYVAPAQASYMLRLRIPNGILNHWQLAGVAEIAERFGGGYADVTTRANLQVREVEAGNAVRVVEAVQDLGLTSRGSGADSIRNVTGSATAGIDPQELVDTRPLAREWHFHVLNDRSLHGLPRKFNVAFDGGGMVPTLEETNDIGFQAVRVGDGAGVAPGIWLRVTVGGITGHKDLARDAGAYCRPDECAAVADAIVRVFIDHGDRTDRKKARLKYLLDTWGLERFLAAVEEKLGRPLPRIAPAFVEPRPVCSRTAHIGVQPQRQDGLAWIGVALPVGRLSVAQMRGLAGIARDMGDGDIRLTVWQNLLLSGIPLERIEAAQAATLALGMDWRATGLRAGLVACTGNRGCKFANADTKGHALDIARHVDARLALDQPVNVHLTGCPNSCAQHYIGDIGLVGVRVPVGDDGDTVEGYDFVVGGGFADQAGIGRELWRAVKAEDCPARVESLLRAWQANRAAPDETFQAFTGRHDIETLQRLATGPAR